jgi:rhomboid-like protein
MEVLQELQKRRVSGSLAEMGVSFSDDAEITHDHAMRGLEWLREKHPLDEETAAAEWAEAEAERLQEELEKRAERLGLYKRGESVEEDVPSQPQQVTNVYGNSVLVQRRQQVEAEEKAKQEAEEKEQKDQPPQPYKGHDLIVSKKVELGMYP